MKRMSSWRRGMFRRWKRLRQSLGKRENSKRITFIVGCQRSGTTMLSRVFEKDLRSISFGEDSELTIESGPNRLRLKPLEWVEDRIRSERPGFIILKPLVESQNTRLLLDYFTGSKSIWIYRDFRDVAASNLRKFGDKNSIKDIRIIAENQTDDWRVEKLSDKSKALVRHYFTPDISPADAAVLFWIFRNELYFEIGLDHDDRVALLQYEALESDPERLMRAIYCFIDQPFPSKRITADTHAQSINRGRELSISPDIEKLAISLNERLDTLWQQRLAGFVS